VQRGEESAEPASTGGSVRPADPPRPRLPCGVTSGPDDWLSQREAVLVLYEAAGVTKRQAMRLLASGLAGPVLRLPGVHLFEAARVAELVGREMVQDSTLDQLCPHGLFVARREVDPGVPHDQQRAALSDGWGYSPWTALWVNVRIERHGPYPLLATTAGYVVAGADIEKAYLGGRLGLTAPGPWFAALAGRRVPTGPGRTWWIRGLDRPRVE
jgi:hypothetical protein